MNQSWKKSRRRPMIFSQEARINPPQKRVSKQSIGKERRLLQRSADEEKFKKTVRVEFQKGRERKPISVWKKNDQLAREGEGWIRFKGETNSGGEVSDKHGDPWRLKRISSNMFGERKIRGGKGKFEPWEC